jgi:hypothetical protein
MEFCLCYVKELEIIVDGCVPCISDMLDKAGTNSSAMKDVICCSLLYVDVQGRIKKSLPLFFFQPQ